MDALGEIFMFLFWFTPAGRLPLYQAYCHAEVLVAWCGAGAEPIESIALQSKRTRRMCIVALSRHAVQGAAARCFIKKTKMSLSTHALDANNVVYVCYSKLVVLRCHGQFYQFMDAPCRPI